MLQRGRNVFNIEIADIQTIIDMKGSVPSATEEDTNIRNTLLQSGEETTGTLRVEKRDDGVEIVIAPNGNEREVSTIIENFKRD